jgi:hypothetical protein
MLRAMAAIYSAVLALVVLGEMVVEAVHGDLLTIEAGHIGVLEIVELVVWLVAIVYIAWPYVREELW